MILKWQRLSDSHSRALLQVAALKFLTVPMNRCNFPDPDFGGCLKLLEGCTFPAGPLCQKVFCVSYCKVLKLNARCMGCGLA
jgi:hypothetical protein